LAPNELSQRGFGFVANCSAGVKFSLPKKGIREPRTHDKAGVIRVGWPDMGGGSIKVPLQPQVGAFPETPECDAPKISLTEPAVKNSKSREKPYKLSDEQGLYVHVIPNSLWDLASDVLPACVP
jgi:hypothetical protein